MSSEEGQFNALQKSLPLKVTHFPEIMAGEYKNPELVAIAKEIEIFNDKIKGLNEQYDNLLKNLKQSFDEHKKSGKIAI